MTIYSVIGLTISETISGTIKNLPWFILILIIYGMVSWLINKLVYKIKYGDSLNDIKEKVK